MAGFQLSQLTFNVTGQVTDVRALKKSKSDEIWGHSMALVWLGGSGEVRIDQATASRLKLGQNVRVTGSIELFNNRIQYLADKPGAGHTVELDTTSSSGKAA